MPNYVSIPLQLPFKFVPDNGMAGIGFDDRWSYLHRQPNDIHVNYRQKWVKSDTTILQIESSIIPESLKVWNLSKQVVKSFSWTAVVNGTGYKVYECTFNISDISEGIYFLYQVTGVWKWISEPIHSKTTWPGTLLATYRNSYNNNAVAWTTGATFKFRFEGAIPPNEFTPEKDRKDYVNQTRTVKTLKGVSYRKEKLLIGIVPPYVIDIINRIFDNDYVNIEGKLFQLESGAKLEPFRSRGYPHMSASADIVGVGAGSGVGGGLTVGDTGSAQAVVIGYDIETAFFGGVGITPVIEVIENG